MIQLFFSAQGRVNRARFWWAAIGGSLGATLLFALMLALLWAIIPGTVDEKGGYSVNGLAALPFVTAMVGYFGLCIWMGVCLGVKRYHDQDKPGIWVLVMLIPFVGGLVYFIQAGCLPGTRGPNRFGPDPLPAPAA